MTFPEEPKSLTEAISRAVRCNNRLFKRRSERQFQMPRARSEPTYASVVAKRFPRESDNVLLGMSKAVNAEDHTITICIEEEPAYRRCKTEYTQRERGTKSISY